MTLKKEQIEKFKKRLLDMRSHLVRTLEGTTKEVKTPDEATGYSQHQADQGTDDFDRTINLEITANDYSLLGQIDRALEKIDEGTYGICEISGKEIPLKRLEALPHARTTVEAQAMLEKGLLGE